jgi:hypothetical protein
MVKEIIAFVTSLGSPIEKPYLLSLGSSSRQAENPAVYSLQPVMYRMSSHFK